MAAASRCNGRSEERRRGSLLPALVQDVRVPEQQQDFADEQAEPRGGAPHRRVRTEPGGRRRTSMRDAAAEGPVRADPWFRPLCALFGALVVAWTVPRLLAHAQIQFRLHWWALAAGLLLFIPGLIGLARLSTTGWVAAWMIGVQAFAAGLLTSAAVLAPVVRGGGEPWIVPVILLAFPASLGALACEWLFPRIRTRRSLYSSSARSRRGQRADRSRTLVQRRSASAPAHPNR